MKILALFLVQPSILVKPSLPAQRVVFSIVVRGKNKRASKNPLIVESKLYFDYMLTWKIDVMAQK